MAGKPTAAPGAKRGAWCPICRVPTGPEWRPFCSRRCADVDLGRWMTGRYAIPAEEEDQPDTGGTEHLGLDTEVR